MDTVEEKREVEEAATRGQYTEGRQLYPADAMTRHAPLEVALLTGGQDRHYAVGLAMALMGEDVSLEIIGSDEVDGPEFQGNPHVRFRNLHGGQKAANLTQRVSRVLFFYARIFHYAATAKPKIFHILWNNKLQILDRTLLMAFYKLMQKRVALTVHNVNAGRRDGKDSWLNRATLRLQYKLADHLFVHTKKMKYELVDKFAVSASDVTIIPYGINNAVPDTGLTREEARRRLGLEESDKAILFFGAIKRYKGLEYLVTAFQQIASAGNYKLIIAGERKKGCEEYLQSIQQTIEQHPSRDKVLQKIEFIPDAETEFYFKAADVAVLPYTEIFQSGILFLAFAFGLPVIATNVGSFAEDIVEGRTGYICVPGDSDNMARTIQRYFEGDLYKCLSKRREEIKQDTLVSHSWEAVAKLTRDSYAVVVDDRV